jgi:hypothetical protein
MDSNQTLLVMIEQLQQQLIDQSQRLEDISNDRTTPSTSFRLPDPPRFDGRPLSLKIWLPAIRAKLRLDSLTGQQAFDYIYNRLELSQ